MDRNEFARQSAGQIDWQTSPLRLEWRWDDFVTADHHRLTIHFACNARVADARADRQLFAERFLTNSEAAHRETIATYFAPSLQAALHPLAVSRQVADALSATDFLPALQKSVEAIAFAVGVEILPPFDFRLESLTFLQQKSQTAADARAAQRTAQLAQQLNEATALYEKFRALRAAAPDVSAGKLIEQLAPHQAGHAMQMLLRADAEAAAKKVLWAVAGNNLARIEPRGASPHVDVFELPNSLGPLRSVQSALLDGKQKLFIGAQSGILIASPENPADASACHSATISSQQGFNRAICVGDRIWASHGAAGVVEWTLGTAEPARSYSGIARHINSFDGQHIFYATDRAIISRDGNHVHEIAFASESPLIALLPMEPDLLAIHRDGTMLRIDQQLQTTVRHRRGNFTAATTLPWLGEQRILLASDDGPIDCISWDDTIVTEFLSAHRGLKMLAATSDILAAVSADRERIIFWHPWDPQRPIGELRLTAHVRHRIASIHFA